MQRAEEANFQTFRDILSTPLIERTTISSKKRSRTVRGSNRRKTAIKPVNIEQDDTNDAEELADFIDYIATEIFANLPESLRSLTHATWLNDPTLHATYTDPLSPTTATRILNTLPIHITDSLTTYSLLLPSQTLPEFLLPLLQQLVATITASPPPPSTTKDLATECEICARSWIPLTYHHLIPREVHAKVVKRGWHSEDQLGNVAWLCRACHSCVHGVAGNEELAREFFTVERLLAREDVRRFAGWVGKVRWKAR